MTLSELPKSTWWILAGVAVLVLALVARNRAQTSANVTGGASVPAGADPNVEATNQAAIAAKTSAFQSLASGLFGLESDIVGGARDTNIAAISGNTVGAQTLLDTQAREYQASVDQAIAAGQNARDVALAGISRDIAFNTNSTTLQTAGVEAGVQYGQQAADVTNAATAAGVARYLADAGVASNADNNRTTLAVTQAQQTTARQANVSSAAQSGGIFGAIAAAVPWLISIL